MKTAHILLAVGLAACTSHGNAGGAAGSPPPPDAAIQESHPACDVYLSCLLAVDPQHYAQTLDEYGEDSECWRTAEHADDCEQACAASFAAIASQCVCEGTTCEPAPSTNTTTPPPPPPTCSDDAREPDDSIAAAEDIGNWQTDAGTITLSNMSICPAGDIDYYQVTVVGNDSYTIKFNVSATSHDGNALDLTFEDASGTTIASGTDELEARQIWVELGDTEYYYVRVASPSGTVSDYHITFVSAYDSPL